MPTSDPTPNGCLGRTKAGNRCKAAPLKGTTYCLAHSDEETRGSTGFGGPQPGAGRPAVPRATDVARRLVEENILAVQRPYWRTLGYEVEIGPDGPRLVEQEKGGAKLYGESKDGIINVSTHDDLGAMMTAAEKLQDRAFGRPKQATEVSGPDGGPVEHDQTVRLPDEQDWHTAVARVLLQTGAHAGPDQDQ